MWKNICSQWLRAGAGTRWPSPIPCLPTQFLVGIGKVLGACLSSIVSSVMRFSDSVTRSSLRDLSVQEEQVDQNLNNTVPLPSS